MDVMIFYNPLRQLGGMTIAQWTKNKVGKLLDDLRSKIEAFEYAMLMWSEQRYSDGRWRGLSCHCRKSSGCPLVASGQRATRDAAADRRDANAVSP